MAVVSRRVQVAIDTLDEIRVLETLSQQVRASEALEAFRVFWASRPTEGVFSAHTRGLVLQPGMLYLMCRGRR